jgi:hypothetical protein
MYDHHGRRRRRVKYKVTDEGVTPNQKKKNGGREKRDLNILKGIYVLEKERRAMRKKLASWRCKKEIYTLLLPRPIPPNPFSISTSHPHCIPWHWQILAAQSSLAVIRFPTVSGSSVSIFCASSFTSTSKSPHAFSRFSQNSYAYQTLQNGRFARLGQ